MDEEKMESIEEPTNDQAEQTEPQGTDWKAEARKWEKRAKANMAKADKLDKLEEANQTELERTQNALKSTQSELESLKAERERAQARERVSQATGIPAHLITGDDEETMTAQAKAIAAYTASQTPTFPTDKGGATGSGAPGITEADIEKETNPVKRVQMRAQLIAQAR